MNTLAICKFSFWFIAFSGFFFAAYLLNLGVDGKGQ